jgi:Nitrile hydratase, alpha chain
MADNERDKAPVYGKVIAKAWRDPSFKAKLLADPQGTLRQAGVSIPAGVTVQVVENTGTHFHFVLPAKPSGALTDEALDKVAGGTDCLGGLPW